MQSNPGNNSEKLRVFICHSSADKAQARALHATLSAMEVDPWLDEESLAPGQDWNFEIRKAVRHTDIVIVCLTKSAVTKSGYLQKEIKYAIDAADEKPEGTQFIIPLRLEECNIPDRLTKWQCVDFYKEDGLAKLRRAFTIKAKELFQTSNSSAKSDWDLLPLEPDFGEKINQLISFQNAEQARLQSAIQALNEQAVKLSVKCYNASSCNDPSVQHMIKDFRDRLRVIETSPMTSEQLNANGRFLVAVHSQIEGRYEDAASEFDSAISLARDQMSQNDSDSAFLPRGVSSREWLTHLLNVCFFRNALLSKELGDYSKSVHLFGQAIHYDQADFISRIYINECSYFGCLMSFPLIVSSFEALEEELTKRPSEDFWRYHLSKDRLLARTQMALATCYAAGLPCYSEFRDIRQSKLWIEKACRSDDTLTMAKVFLAMALRQQTQDTGRQNALLHEVFAATQRHITGVTQPTTLVLLYYVLAICVAFTCGVAAVPSYTIRIYELAPKLPMPERLRLFSPLTQCDLSVREFIEEVRTFENEYSWRR